MRMVAMEKWLWLLFVELMSIFMSQICTPKWAWKSAFYRNKWNAAAGQRRLSRHWKLFGLRVLIKHFKESCLASKTMLRTQRSRPFPKPEQWLTFDVLAKGGSHENFLEGFNFTKSWKWHILDKLRRWWGWCNGRVAVTFVCWAMSIFISQICPPKWAWKKCFLLQQLECRCGQTATVTSLKVYLNEGPDQALKGKLLISKNYSAYAT